jgi:hypothetical protein
MLPKNLLKALAIGYHQCGFRACIRFRTLQLNRWNGFAHNGMKNNFVGFVLKFVSFVKAYFFQCNTMFSNELQGIKN